MENELRDRRVKGYSAMKSVIDFVRGGLIAAIGLFLIFGDKFGFTMNNIDKNFRYFFGGISVLYGSWRIYRGFKKDNN